jgi:acetyltransferase
MTDMPNDSDTKNPGPSDGAPEPLPSNYPSQYTKEAVVRGGPVLLRPIRPDDGRLMLDLFGTFSPETIYRRFFTFIKMSAARVRNLTHIDYRRQMALVAERRWSGECILTGVARYNTPEDAPQGEAEMAIVVGDPYRGLGIGTALLDVMLKTGRREGFSLFYGLVQYDNKAVPRLFEKLNQKHRVVDNGTEWRYEVNLSDVKID